MTRVAGVRGVEVGGRSVLARVYRHSFSRFAFFGVLGLTFDVSLLALLVSHTALRQTGAVTVAFAVTYLLNFFLNRRFSFAEATQATPTTPTTGDHQPNDAAAPSGLRSQLVRFAPQVGLDFVLTLTAVDLLTGLGVAVLIARVLAGGSNAAINYTLYRWWTFRPVAATFRGTPSLH